jgi:hypothetical protein
MADDHKQTTVGTPLLDSGTEDSGIVGDAGETTSAPPTAKSSKADMRSQKPSGYGFHSQKQYVVAATEDAAIAIARRHHTLAENDRFDGMVEMSDRYDRESAAATYYKQKYKQEKRIGISDNDMSKIELKYKRAKRGEPRFLLHNTIS